MAKTQLVNLDKLKQVAEDISKRGGKSNDLFINKKMLAEPRDFRILPPLPSMDGLYFIEVPIWWIDSTKIISLEYVGEDCAIQQYIDQLKDGKDPEILKILNSKKDGKYPKIKKEYEYWVPGLEFRFEIRNNEIQGIYNADGTLDMEALTACVADGKCKILSAPQTLLNGINQIATSRNGMKMFDPVEGFSLQLTKSGDGVNTKYNAIKMDTLPIPEQFLGIDNQIDPDLIVRSGLLNAEYQYAVIENFVYGDQLPEDRDSYLLFPELKEAVKAFFAKDEEEKPHRKAERPRPGRPAVQEEVEEVEEAPAVRAATRSPIGRVASPAPVARPTPRAAAPAARPKRNLVDDVMEDN